MSNGYIKHMTRDGDRWDLLAWHYYGDPYAYEGIIRANPAIPIMPILPGGLTLFIPVLDPPAPTPPAGMPPWT